LALATEVFACRHCHRLTYESQNETLFLRTIRRARKIRMRLGAGFSFAEPSPTRLSELTRLRQVCARAINPGFGLHPNHDHAKGLCPWFARGLMLELSNAKITGTKDASFRVISSLLYEAVSGVPGADLKRACDEVLRNATGDD
jgi:hypothetical protein